MKTALIEGLRQVSVGEIETPVPLGNQVRIAVRLGGVCGSDSSVYSGKIPAEFPIVPGHEAVGVVDAIGAEVKTISVGQRVTIHPNLYCSKCDLCVKGLTNLCRDKIRLGIDAHGVFAEYVVAPEEAVIPIPEDIPDEVAVFTEPLAVVLHALKLSEVKPQGQVLVFGAGIIGQLTLQLALFKSGNVTVCDLIESRLKLARRMGAQHVLGDRESINAQEDRFDVIFETSGAPSALEQSIRLAAPGGTIVLLGLPGQEYPISSVPIVRKELSIKGSMIYTDEFPRSLDLLRQGVINTEALVSSCITIAELSENLEQFNAPQRMKTLVRIECDS